MLTVSLALIASVATSAGDRLAVIVNPARKASPDDAWLRLVYLKQRRDWEDGEPIVPVNRESGSAARQAFADRILRLSPNRLTSYWNERYFDGVLPPITFDSDRAVVRYVASEPNAIGYVAPDAVDESVKVVLMLE